MGILWESYKSIIYANCTVSDVERNSVVYWKNQLFASSVIYLIPLSLVALVPGVYMASKQGLIGMLAADFIAVCTVLGVAFLPGLSVYIRKMLFNATLYFISIVMLHYLGSHGPGMLYLLAVTIFVVLSMEQLYGYIALILNTLTCIIFAVAIHFEFASTVILDEYQLDSWIGVSSNLVFLSGTAVFMIPHLFRGLQSAFDEQKFLKGKLEHTVEDLKLSEQKFKALVQDGSDLIAILDESANYKYVAPTTESILGITAEEFVGTNAFDYIHQDDRERLAAIIAGLAENEQKAIKPFRFTDAGGNWRWIETVITNMLENPAVEGFVVNSRDVSDHIERESKLRESLQEKETLLMEIHHRVKNNLAVISGLLELQAFDEEDEGLKRKLLDSVGRIQTMGSIHEILYRSNSYSRLQLGENIKMLVTNLVESFQYNTNIELDFDLQPVILNINQAIPCSLVVNEVVTNVYKHAFDKNKKGRLSVEISNEQEKVAIRIKDNGKGLPENFGEVSKESSLGLRLIDILTNQLNGEYRYDSLEQGTLFSLNFTKADVKGIGSAHLT